MLSGGTGGGGGMGGADAAAGDRAGVRSLLAERGTRGTVIRVNLKLHTDFALRTLLFLAYKREQASVEEIASAYRISRDHLFKVVRRLGRLGYVTARAGRRGGVRLAREPEHIRIDQVVAAFEGRAGVLPCVADSGACVLEPGCALRAALIDAENAFYQELAKLTLADILRPNADRRSGGVYNLTVRRRPPESNPTSSLKGLDPAERLN
jgi:Rrf2 family nitric oxide-sensitive transcriptional repressor